MAATPEITVVIPVFNRAELVRETLDSVLKQDLRPLAVILVDNNSTDNTLSVLEQWKQKNNGNGLNIRVLQEKTPGAAAARNRGLREVETPLTMFFDSDDLMAPGHCRRVAEGFRNNLDADIIGWDCDSSQADGSSKLLGFAADKLLYNVVQLGSLATQRYAARTELFLRAGGWDESCMGWDDIELGIRLLDLSPKVVKLTGAPTVLVRFTTESITGESFSRHPERWEYAMTLIAATVRRSSSPLLGPERKALRILRLRLAILAGDYTLEGHAEEGERLLATILREETSRRFRLLYRLTARYRAVGLRGASKLLSPLF